MTRLRTVVCALLLCAAGVQAGSTVTVRKAALATASPIATRIGLSVLRDGGNAIDASVAVAFALAVVHPQAGNLGGGGYLLYYDASTGDVWSLDFSEIAPGATKRESFQSAPDSARHGPRAAATPGTVAGLGVMHAKFGHKPWKALLAPAAVLAREGFPVDDALAADLFAAADARKLSEIPSTAAVFYPEGKPPVAGSTLVQRDLAWTIERLAAEGARDFYTGEVAAKLADGIREAGGILGHRDLREYTTRWRSPIQLRFGGYDIYTVPPPSGAALVVGETLNILSGFDLAKLGFQSPSAIHLIVEAQRRAFIDRNRYLSDPAVSRIAVRDLLATGRAAAWRESIAKDRVTPTASLTDPGNLNLEGEHTTHFTIVDAAGNVAAVTTSLGENFGSGFVAPGTGVLLNNAMAQFANGERPNSEGLIQGRVNAVEAKRRATSSMSPTFVLRDGKPELALGSRGGAAIPTTIAQLILAVTVYGRTLPDAVAAPRFHHQALPDEIVYERDRVPDGLVDALNAMGHPVRGRESIGDVHAVQITKEKIVAVADPRHGGAAGGY